MRAITVVPQSIPIAIQIERGTLDSFKGRRGGDARFPIESRKSGIQSGGVGCGEVVDPCVTAIQ